MSRTQGTTYYTYLPSPIGKLLLTSNGAELTGVFMEPHRHGPEVDAGWVEDGSIDPLPQAAQQLTEYFQGQRQEFNLPLSSSGTDFQQRVWAELRRIGYGETWSYGDLARSIEKPKAFRAVGLANGRNPHSIIVPCHRVIGTNGTPTGYGGGVPRKIALLQFEAAVRKDGPTPMPHCG